MLKPYTVSFFGHRIIEDFNRVEKKAETLIRDLILQKEYVEFLVGRGVWSSWSGAAGISTRSYPPP